MFFNVYTSTKHLTICPVIQIPRNNPGVNTGVLSSCQIDYQLDYWANKSPEKFAARGRVEENARLSVFDNLRTLYVM